MDKKDVKNAERTEFDTFLKETGFCRKGEGVYIKVNENIINNISFEFGSFGFTCAIAMQPLYIKEYFPSDFLHLTFGSRLSRFKIVQREWWLYDTPIEGIEEIKRLLIKNGLPWFDRYGSPEGIIEFISSGLFRKYGLRFLNEFFQHQYLGFSLLYVGRIDEGIKELQKMLNEIKDDAVEFMHEYKTEIGSLIEKIREHQDDRRMIFEDIIRDNKISLKI